MKRLSSLRVDQIASDIVRYLICQHGSCNLDRISMTIRRKAREQLGKGDKNISQNSDFSC